jgi:hypothetical protein
MYIASAIPAGVHGHKQKISLTSMLRGGISATEVHLTLCLAMFYIIFISLVQNWKKFYS